LYHYEFIYFYFIDNVQKHPEEADLSVERKEEKCATCECNASMTTKRTNADIDMYF